MSSDGSWDAISTTSSSAIDSTPVPPISTQAPAPSPTTSSTKPTPHGSISSKRPARPSDTPPKAKHPPKKPPKKPSKQPSARTSPLLTHTANQFNHTTSNENDEEQDPATEVGATNKSSVNSNATSIGVAAGGASVMVVASLVVLYLRQKREAAHDEYHGKNCNYGMHGSDIVDGDAPTQLPKWSLLSTPLAMAIQSPPLTSSLCSTPSRRSEKHVLADEAQDSDADPTLHDIFTIRECSIASDQSSESSSSSSFVIWMTPRASCFEPVVSSVAMSVCEYEFSSFHPLQDNSCEPSDPVTAFRHWR